VYAGTINDASDAMLANAWRADHVDEGGLPYGWGASDFPALYWDGRTATTLAFVGLPTATLARIPDEDVGDVLLSAQTTGLRADVSDIQRILRRSAYGSYPARAWSPLVLGGSPEPRLSLATSGTAPATASP
jgi:hypothetical protein